MRIKRGTIHVKKRNKLLKLTKGYRWGRKSKIKLARTAVLKAGVHAYRDRKLKKRDFRKLWTIKINAGARLNGLTYSKLIHRLKLANITLDRKSLAHLAEFEPETFAALLKELPLVEKK
jgi:large subunit ribosomal protein L20